MKYLPFIAISLLFLSCNQPDTSTVSSELTLSMEDRKSIKDDLNGLVEELWSVGYPAKDTVLVSSLYHSEFVLVDDEGTVFTKEDELAYVAEYGDQYESFSYTIEDVRLFENGTGVVFAQCRFLGTSVDGAFSTEYLQTLTFSGIDGEWKIIYSHVSGVKEEAIPDAPQ